ncbi:toxin-antitoxin system TumE family protein [Chitinimonas sp.]|uniref:toxin-antitoxin system TumE family protein n=1 Tax=Chitinimonas sp. TaxID=1934313 RepID=UPI002F95FAE7
MADKKIIDDSHTISDKRGNGQLRREVWVDSHGRVTRYNLAYINQHIFQGDNGRVVGYDNAHDGHHRHYFGVVEPVEFISFEDVEARFERDWLALRERA